VTSAIGRKIAMGLTGLLLIGFLVTHMSANLLVIFDADAYNAYSEKLLSNPLIYLAEAALVLFFVSHLVLGIVVQLRNRAARPEAYGLKNRAGGTSRKSLASTTMILSGIVMLVFVPLHIVTFKFGPHYDWAAHEGARDLHRLVIEIFHKPAYVIWYLIALPILGAHAWHGFGSAFESLGVHYRPWLAGFGRALAVLLTVGFAMVPIYVYFFTGGAS
jgi:succinate dehydrogenase / fumarate reductase cytochrome b subunit